MAATCSAGRTALHYAAMNMHETIIQFLLEIDELRNVCSMQDVHGWTALHKAAEHSSISVVQKLLQVMVNR
jgi:ankyrin repeat protein